MTLRGEDLPASQKPSFLQLRISDRNEIQAARSLVAYSCLLRHRASGPWLSCGEVVVVLVGLALILVVMLVQLGRKYVVNI